MKFYDGEEDNNKIIKNYFSTNNYIKVNYLFDERSITYNYTKEKENEIASIMIEQAIKRDKDLFDTINTDTKIYLTNNLLSLWSIILALKGNLPVLLCISFIAYVIALKNFKNSIKKLEEMKKFRIFYSLREELAKKENNDITKMIEFESIYREPLNIGSLDEFSFGEIETIRKELKRRTNKNV